MSYSAPNSAAGRVKQSLGQSRYHVEVHDCQHVLSVLRFWAEGSFSHPWHYNVSFTCDCPDIACGTLLLKRGCFMFQTGVPAVPVRTVYGVVQSFRRLSTSADETRYSLMLVPRIALLQHSKSSEIYLNQSVTEVVEQVLHNHGLEGPDFEFRLSREYPKRELITQWRETDLEFVQRLLAEVGIFWRFEMDDRLEQDVVVFQDTHEPYPVVVTLPLRNPAGMNDGGQESVWHIQTAYNVVSDSTATHDYNYRQALISKENAESISSTEDEVHYQAEPLLSEGDAQSTEIGTFYARMRYERILNGQLTVTGRSSSPFLSPGQVLKTDSALPDGMEDGLVVTAVRSRGSRETGFQLKFDAIPYSDTFCFRPALLKRPVISGSLPARVESAEQDPTYACLDEQGRYRVQLDFDRKNTKQDNAYLWLRMAKPYAGDTHGWHAPLLHGTEVSVMFDSGDPDKPYIAYAQHDSKHPDHVARHNRTRYIWRTPANNKLRMEDQRGEEHIKLATEFGKSQLNMGHLVNAKREKRGSGFELRTDKFGAVLAAQGLYLTADKQPQAQGSVLEMAPAFNQINRANSEMQALNSAAQQAGALVSDIQAQMGLVKDRVLGLQSAVLLASATGGVALTSGEHLQLSSASSTMINTGQHLDIGTMKNLSVSVEQALGLFVHKGGAKLVANQGDVDIEAQHNKMSLFAKQQVEISSTEDEIFISTPKTLTLNAGGSYLKLSPSGIKQGTIGDCIVKASRYLVPMRGASSDAEMSIHNENSSQADDNISP